MEYGLISKLNQFTDNRALEIQKVQPTQKSSEISSKDELKQIQKEILVKEKKVSDVKEVKNETSTPSKYEVVLTNMNFGFNDSSKDFYVKAIRGNVENQYPTQDMMKLKSYLMNLNSNIS
jgi:hypothetical protein